MQRNTRQTPDRHCHCRAETPSIIQEGECQFEQKIHVGKYTWFSCYFGVLLVVSSRGRLIRSLRRVRAPIDRTTYRQTSNATSHDVQIDIQCNVVQSTVSFSHACRWIKNLNRTYTPHTLPLDSMSILVLALPR